MKSRIPVSVTMVVIACTAYVLWLRPWMLRWEATADEQKRALPGDDLLPHATHITTHAVTIAARPDKIWPWLVQMGQDRAGFYTHNWVEKLLLSGIPDVYELHPEWQNLKVGDLMRTNREIRRGHPMGWPVAMIEPNRVLAVESKGAPPGSWALILQPTDGQTTRLISRDRAAWRPWQSPFRLLVFEPLHAYMQTGVLLGIKRRVEHARNSRLPTGTSLTRAS